MEQAVLTYTVENTKN